MSKEVTNNFGYNEIIKNTVPPKANSISVGEEFINWAEKYWHLKSRMAPDKMDEFSEAMDYDTHIRNLFIQKINDILVKRINDLL